MSPVGCAEMRICPRWSTHARALPLGRQSRSRASRCSSERFAPTRSRCRPRSGAGGTCAVAQVPPTPLPACRAVARSSLVGSAGGSRAGRPGSRSDPGRRACRPSQRTPCPTGCGRMTGTTRAAPSLRRQKRGLASDQIGSDWIGPYGTDPGLEAIGSEWIRVDRIGPDRIGWHSLGEESALGPRRGGHAAHVAPSLQGRLVLPRAWPDGQEIAYDPKFFMVKRLHITPNFLFRSGVLASPRTSMLYAVVEKEGFLFRCAGCLPMPRHAPLIRRARAQELERPSIHWFSAGLCGAFAASLVRAAQARWSETRLDVDNNALAPVA